MYGRIAGALMYAARWVMYVYSDNAGVTCTPTAIAELQWQGSDASRSQAQICSESLVKTVHTFRQCFPRQNGPVSRGEA